MKLLFNGKTKDVFDLEDGTYLLRFKDDATGVDGVFDPGANTVGLTVAGMGAAGLRLTEFFFGKIEAAGFATHFVRADLGKAEMVVRPAEVFGKGIEVICRYRAVGSFLRRYEMYASSGDRLDSLVEMTLKDDERGDPFISRDTLNALGIMTFDEYDKITALTVGISQLIRETLAENDLELYDIKLEFGRIKPGDGSCESEIVLIDEISGGNMRVYKNTAPIEPLDLVRLLLG